MVGGLFGDGCELTIGVEPMRQLDLKAYGYSCNVWEMTILCNSHVWPIAAARDFAARLAAGYRGW